MVTSGGDVSQLDLRGGDLALDFANTLNGPRDGAPSEDLLDSYDDLVVWARRAGALPTRSEPRGGADHLERARCLRNAIYDIFTSLDSGGEPPPASLRLLIAIHAEAVQRGTLDCGRWVWTGTHPDRPLWAIAVAAVDLLRSDRVARVKSCGQCRLIFLDRSRNRSRRWCSMDECGAQVKMRRYRRRSTERLRAGR